MRESCPKKRATPSEVSWRGREGGGCHLEENSRVMGELVPNRMTPHLHRVHHRHHCPRYQEQGSESGFRSQIMDLDHKSGSRIELWDQESKIIIKNHVTTPIAFCISNFVAVLCI